MAMAHTFGSALSVSHVSNLRLPDAGLRTVYYEIDVHFE
jgi:hypothetical protein